METQQIANEGKTPHVPVDPTLPNTPSSALVTDVHGRVVSTIHDANGELVAEASIARPSVEQ